MILGIDVSKWNLALDWEKVKAGGVEFAFVKATQGNYTVDPLLREHVARAKAAGLLVGLYHWCDPLSGDTAQAQYFLDKTADLGLDVAVADVEQFWQDWQEWSAGTITKYLAPERIAQNAHNVLEYWRVRGKKPVLYSRASFIHSFSMPITKWVGDYPLWMAHYPYAKGTIIANWEDVRPGGKYAPGITSPNMPQGVKAAAWKFWQFSGDKFILPGVSGKLDLNYWNGDLASLRAFFGAGAPPVVEPPASEELTTEQKVERLWKAHPELWK